MKNLLLIFPLLFCITCETNEHRRERHKKEVEEILSKMPRTQRDPAFVYRTGNDGLSRGHEPFLIGADGWIIKDCDFEIKSEYNGKKIKVISQSVKHEGWGRYNGSLNVELIDSRQTINIDYDCFNPNYEIGEWVRKPNK